MLLTATDLANMRAMQEEAMPDTATISRRAAPGDSAGDWATTITTVGTSKCRVATRQGERQDKASGNMVAMESWVGHFPVDTDIQRGDQVQVSGRTFEVERVTGGNDWSTAVTVEFRETAGWG